jgi:hypothetical protein
LASRNFAANTKRLGGAAAMAVNENTSRVENKKIRFILFKVKRKVHKYLCPKIGNALNTKEKKVGVS